MKATTSSDDRRARSRRKPTPPSGCRSPGAAHGSPAPARRCAARPPSTCPAAGPSRPRPGSPSPATTPPRSPSCLATGSPRRCCSPVCSRISSTIRTARSRSSSGYFCGLRRAPVACHAPSSFPRSGALRGSQADSVRQSTASRSRRTHVRRVLAAGVGVRPRPCGAKGPSIGCAATSSLSPAPARACPAVVRRGCCSQRHLHDQVPGCHRPGSGARVPGDPWWACDPPASQPSRADVHSEFTRREPTHTANDARKESEGAEPKPQRESSTTRRRSVAACPHSPSTGQKRCRRGHADRSGLHSRGEPDVRSRCSCAPRGAMYRVGVKGLHRWGLSQQAPKLGQPDPGDAGEGGSSPDNAGTGRHRQTVRVRQARREGVRRVNQRLNPLKGRRLQPGGYGPGSSARPPEHGWATPAGCRRPGGPQRRPAA